MKFRVSFKKEILVIN
eukprot:gene23890-31002_t